VRLGEGMVLAVHDGAAHASSWVCPQT